MSNESLSRREFLERTAMAAGALALASGTVQAATPTTQGAAALAAPATQALKRTAVDQVTLGATGLKLSRLGIGTGSNNGVVQLAAGQDSFDKLIHYAYDQGITHIDTSKTYRTFNQIAAATKGLPREKLFIMSALPDQQQPDVLAEIDNHRKAFNTDYVDCMLVHCMFKNGWMDTWKRTLDAMDEAHSKKWILSKGVSCHSLPALRNSIESDWTQVHFVRVNPQGIRMDGMEEVNWVSNGSPVHDVAPVLAELKNMKAKNRGVIGMKIMGNGEFKTDAERERSVRFAMSLPEVDAVVVGFKSTDEIDKAIKWINTALADQA
jgi:predicted aldo/keto reductase-like oxidoreductase